jgi:hypothetical protein
LEQLGLSVYLSMYLFTCLSVCLFVQVVEPLLQPMVTPETAPIHPVRDLVERVSKVIGMPCVDFIPVEDVHDALAGGAVPGIAAAVDGDGGERGPGGERSNPRDAGDIIAALFPGWGNVRKSDRMVSGMAVIVQVRVESECRTVGTAENHDTTSVAVWDHQRQLLRKPFSCPRILFAVFPLLHKSALRPCVLVQRGSTESEILLVCTGHSNKVIDVRPHWLCMATWLPNLVCSKICALFLVLCSNFRQGTELGRGPPAKSVSEAKRLAAQQVLKRWNECVLLLEAVPKAEPKEESSDDEGDDEDE